MKRIRNERGAANAKEIFQQVGTLCSSKNSWEIRVSHGSEDSSGTRSRLTRYNVDNIIMRDHGLPIALWQSREIIGDSPRGESVIYEFADEVWVNWKPLRDSLHLHLPSISCTNRDTRKRSTFIFRYYYGVRACRDSQTFFPKVPLLALVHVHSKNKREISFWNHPLFLFVPFTFFFSQPCPATQGEY